MRSSKHWITLIISLGFLVLSGHTAVALQDQWRPTSIITGATAYALSRGELAIGSYGVSGSLTPPDFEFDFLAQLRSTNVSYGLTDRLHLGTAIANNVLWGPNIYAKFSALHFPAARITVAVPFSLNVGIDPFFVHTGSGSNVSWQLGHRLAFHGGFRFGASLERVSFDSFHGSLTYDIFENAKLSTGINYWRQFHVITNEEGTVTNSGTHSYANVQVGTVTKQAFLVNEINLSYRVYSEGIDLLEDFGNAPFGVWISFRF